MTMLRYNEGKTPLSLIPTSFSQAIVDGFSHRGAAIPTKLIWQVGDVLAFGAKKYNAHNWRKGGSWASVLNSALRHTLKMIAGSTHDHESQLPESGHLGCNLAFLLEFQRLNLGEDDRFLVSGYLGLRYDDQDLLLDVWNHLLDWQDGAGQEALQKAICSLAEYVEDEVPTVPPAAYSQPFLPLEGLVA